MNSTHDNGENGRLDKDLDKIGRAYTQLEAEEPPELLDLAIRNSARRAVEKKPRRIKFGWLHGLTTAAVFVLALSVIIHQRENQPAAGTAKDLVAPAPAAAASETRDQALGQTFRDSRQKVSAAPVQQTITTDTDEIQEALEKAVEKKKTDKPVLESVADAAEDAGQAAAAKPVVVSAPPPAEPEARDDIGLQAERQLRSIIAMKRNGDQNWKESLKAFIDEHPGYPLPDELKD